MAQSGFDRYASNVLGLVDLDRYPIDRLESEEGAACLRRCREHMARHGWCNLEGFIRPDGLQLLAGEANGLLPDAEPLTITRTIYGGKVDLTLPEGDPRRREITHHALQLADDQLPSDTLIQRLYTSDALTEFIRLVQGKPRLYRYADEFQALNIVALEPGRWHGWHYDYNECTVTLLLQAAEEGGEFTFLPNVRTADDENREVVERFLGGDMSMAQTFSRDAGALTLFRGEFSLHGVTEVKGACRGSRRSSPMMSSRGGWPATKSTSGSTVPVCSGSWRSGLVTRFIRGKPTGHGTAGGRGVPCGCAKTTRCCRNRIPTRCRRH